MQVNRRVVLGGGVLAIGGTAAVAVGQASRGRRWLHAAGILDGPDLEPPARGPEVSWSSLRSPHHPGAVRWGIASPPEPTAVVVCLHGRNASASFVFDDLGVHRFVAAAGLRWAVAAVDGGTSSYWHPRSDGTDDLRLLLDDLLPAVDARLGGPLPVLLLGWSMGGYGALLAASERPERIVAVAASAPAVWPSFREAAAGAFDGETDFARHDLRGRQATLERLPVGLWCGRDDPFAGNVRELAAAIGATVSIDDGFHESATWRSFLPAQLRFFERAVAADGGLPALRT